MSIIIIVQVNTNGLDWNVTAVSCRCDLVLLPRYLCRRYHFAGALRHEVPGMQVDCREPFAGGGGRLSYLGRSRQSLQTGRVHVLYRYQAVTTARRRVAPLIGSPSTGPPQSAPGGPGSSPPVLPLHPSLSLSLSLSLSYFSHPSSLLLSSLSSYLRNAYQEVLTGCKVDAGDSVSYRWTTYLLYLPRY